MIQAVQQYLAAVGIKASIQTVDYATYISEVHQRTKMDKPMFLDDWNDDVAAFILRDRYETATTTTGRVNMSGISVSTIDQLVNAANRNLNAASRNAELLQAQKLVVQDAPTTWGVVLNNTAAWSTKVHGLIRTNVGTMWADQNTWVG
jgi:ABC-type transport system substrate-binding protein